MQKIIEFLTVEQDQDFKNWHSNNQNGFYLNERGKKKVMLHKVGCKHLQGLGPWSEADDYCSTSKFKIASGSSEGLVRWAKNNGSKLDSCRDCQPI